MAIDPAAELESLLSLVPPAEKPVALEVIDLATMQARLASNSKTAVGLVRIYILARWLLTTAAKGSEAETKSLAAADRSIAELREMGDGELADSIKSQFETIGLLNPKAEVP